MIPRYNLIENSDNLSKMPGSLWQYYRVKPALNGAGALIYILVLKIIVIWLILNKQ